MKPQRLETIQFSFKWLTRKFKIEELDPDCLFSVNCYFFVRSMVLTASFIRFSPNYSCIFLYPIFCVRSSQKSFVFVQRVKKAVTFFVCVNSLN